MAQYGIYVTLVPGMVFAITGDSREELAKEYEFFGGDTSWLVGKMDGMIPATEQGEGVGALPAILGEVVDDLRDEPAEDVAPEEPETPQEVKDPWTNQMVPVKSRKPAAARSEPSRGTSRPAPRQPESDVYTDEDRFGNQWTMGLPEAPPCKHGERSARKKWTDRSGKQRTAYKCAKGLNDYANACDFHEWPN